MRICHCFIGLLRCIDKTAENLKSFLMDEDHEYIIVCVTWESQDTAKFQKEFPDAIIYKIADITEKNNVVFDEWKEGLQLHISLRRSEEKGWPYDGNSGKFHHYRQFYLLRKAADIVESLHKQNNYHLISRLRTDTKIQSLFASIPISSKYEVMMNFPKNNIFFFDSHRNGLIEGEGCPDQFYIGPPDAVIMALKCLDYTHKYKITYVETLSKWFPTPQLEENIIQAESLLYYFLTGEGYVPNYLPYQIQIIRETLINE